MSTPLSPEEEAAKRRVWERIFLTQREVDAVWTLLGQGYRPSEIVNDILSLRVDSEPVLSGSFSWLGDGAEVPDGPFPTQHDYFMAEGFPYEHD